MYRLSLIVSVVAVLAMASGCAPRETGAVTVQGGMSLAPASDVAVQDYAGDVGPAQVFEVVRPLDQPLTLGRVHTSCTCVKLSSEKTSFAAGERALITMRVVDHPVAGNVYMIDVEVRAPIRTTFRRQVFPTEHPSTSVIPTPAAKPVEPAPAVKEEEKPVEAAPAEAETKASEAAPAEAKKEETPAEAAPETETGASPVETADEESDA